MAERLLAIQDAIPQRCDHRTQHRGRGRHNTPKYGLLFSASAGCLQHVRYWHEEQGVPLDAASDNHADWDVLSYAEWSTELGAEEVKRYIQQRLSASGASAVDPRSAMLARVPQAGSIYLDNVDSSTGPLPPCPGITTHGDVTDPVGMLVGAAESGCMRCTSFLVTVKHVNPLQRSKGVWRMSALGAARAGASVQWPGCDTVLEFLHAHIARHGLSPEVSDDDL